MRLRYWTHSQKDVEYDPESGVSTVIKLDSPRKEGEACPGFSAKEKHSLGLYVNFAIFKDERGVVFYAGSKGWSLNSQEVKLSHSRPFPCFSRFRVFESGECVFSFTYSHLGRSLYAFVDPTYDKIDQDADFFLEYVAENATSKEWLSNIENIWSSASTQPINPPDSFQPPVNRTLVSTKYKENP